MIANAKLELEHTVFSPTGKRRFHIKNASKLKDQNKLKGRWFDFPCGLSKPALWQISVFQLNSSL